MKYIVEVNAKWLVSIEADSVLNAEHKLLEYNGIWGAMAFDRQMMKTDTFAGAVQFCEMVSMDELVKMINDACDKKVEAVSAEIERQDNVKAIEEMEKKLAEMKQKQADLDNKANDTRYWFERAEELLGKERR